MVFGIVLFVSETLNNNLLFVCLEIYWGSLILTLIHYLTLHDTICILRQKKKKKAALVYFLEVFPTSYVLSDDPPDLF